jgi:hypothetical protein
MRSPRTTYVPASSRPTEKSRSSRRIGRRTTSASGSGRDGAQAHAGPLGGDQLTEPVAQRVETGAGDGRHLEHVDRRRVRELVPSGSRRGSAVEAISTSWSRTRSAMARPSGRSSLLSTMTWGRSSSDGSCLRSSSRRMARSRTGSRSGSNGAASRTCSSTRQRSMWRRNWMPRPLPSAAPSIRPGTSASTTSIGSPVAVSPPRISPRWGVRVVNGQASTRGVAADRRPTSEDLPAEGKPTRPTSAMSLSSSRSDRSVTCSPCSANIGTRR